jgi:hypothetical protein
MKNKLALFVVFALSGVILFPFSKGYAEYQMYTCDVVQAGIEETGDALFKFRPVGMTKAKPFVAPAGREKEMLAIAISAMVSGMKVKAMIDYEMGGEIRILRLFAE